MLTGPRRAGKTFLLRHLFPAASYVLLEDPDIVARLRADPQEFLDGLEEPCILDEVQNVPEIFAHVRARIDRTPSRRLRWILTGSQEAPLMQSVSESLADRAAVFQLRPFSPEQSPKVSPLRGGHLPRRSKDAAHLGCGSARTCRPTWNGTSAPSPTSATWRRSAASCGWSPAATARS